MSCVLHKTHLVASWCPNQCAKAAQTQAGLDPLRKQYNRSQYFWGIACPTGSAEWFIIQRWYFHTWMHRSRPGDPTWVQLDMSCSTKDVLFLAGKGNFYLYYYSSPSRGCNWMPVIVGLSAPFFFSHKSADHLIPPKKRWRNLGRRFSVWQRRYISDAKCLQKGNTRINWIL